ncbi:hypothetical protein K2173_019903 [Erythroxylum novogranatense]|uniref:Band 7 domain-containing protein n=1 Tax=Erythroxylum novogranatense TaxID=1862640 RepID=A0AAV8U9Z1_9ROSI|nr:hypothetical protein K2173_019903 [Erythroxylum novogranatense]
MGNFYCCIRVDQSTVSIKETFGKFDHVLDSGFYCKPCSKGSQLAGHLSLGLQQLDVRCETKTKDNVLVNVVTSVQYRALANKDSDSFSKLSNTRNQIQAYVFDVLDEVKSANFPVIRAKVSKLKLDDVFEQKNDISKAVEEELEKAMSGYGCEIVKTLIVDIEPAKHVARAMNEINAAARMRLAADEKAEAEKIIQIKRAEAEAESKYLAGVATEQQAIVDGLRDSVPGFSVNVPGTTAKDILHMVLLTQHFDTMKEIAAAASNSSAVLIAARPGVIGDMATQIQDEMGNFYCCIRVDQSTVSIKETFGKFDHVLDSVCCCMPSSKGSQLAGRLSLWLHQLDVEAKTKDNVLVNVVASVQYQALVNKASDSFYNLSYTRNQIQAYVFDVIRARVSKLKLDDVFEQKNDISKAVEEELEKVLWFLCIILELVSLT